jgi:hypothetical protein
MIKSLKVLAMSLPLAAAAIVLSPGAASAAREDCPSNRFCAWANDGFSGTRAQWARGTNDAHWYNNGMHDNAESLYNRAASSSTVPDNVVVYLDVNYGRAAICVIPGETFDTAMNDNDYDSHQWVHSCA